MRRRRNRRQIAGFITVSELVVRLHLTDAQTILEDVRLGRLRAYRLPGHKGLRNAPYYFKDEDVESYIQDWHIPVLVATVTL